MWVSQCVAVKGRCQTSCYVGLLYSHKKRLYHKAGAPRSSCPCLLSTRITVMHHLFYVDAGDPNSGPHEQQAYYWLGKPPVPQSISFCQRLSDQGPMECDRAKGRTPESLGGFLLQFSAWCLGRDSALPILSKAFLTSNKMIMWFFSLCLCSLLCWLILICWTILTLSLG